MNIEKKLICGLKKQKTDALEKTIGIYTPYVNVIVYNIIGSVMTNEDIEEVISDVFLSLWKNAERLDTDKENIRAYLGTIARNCAKNKLRELQIFEEINENMAYENEEIEKYVEKDNLLKIISKLGEPDSEIFIRFYYYDETILNISNVMGIGISTVKSKLSRGRKKLKEIIEKQGRDNL